jgi:hypothetical protein
MSPLLTRSDLVEALHKLDEVEKHPAMMTLLSASRDEAEQLLAVVLELPEDVAGFFRREQAIGELRSVRSVSQFFSDWKTATEQAVRDLDNNPQHNDDNGS